MATKKSIDLSCFKEQIKMSGVQKLDVSAYRMDSNPQNNILHMAYYAGLGTPSCCDYLYVTNKTSILIEDTQLGKAVNCKLGSIDQNKKEQILENAKETIITHFKEMLVKENCLKVYGSRLILCCLMQEQEKILKELKNNTFLFWFVITDEHDIKAIDNMEIVSFLEEQFKECLKGILQGAKLVTEVKILFSTELKRELQKKAA